jgi:pyruvate kinase
VTDQLRRTKIVATIGPSTDTLDGIRRLIEAGIDVVRLNFSHGDHAHHGAAIDMVREAAAAVGKTVAILQDLAGPKIRLGELGEGEVHLGHGATVTLVGDGVADRDNLILPVSYPHLADDVAVKDPILLADGLVELVVERIEGERVLCRVLNEGNVSSRKGVNLPSTRLRIPAFTDKDRADLAYGIERGVDYVAMSFVRDEHDLREVREAIDAAGGDTPPALLAKIEKPSAVERIEAILEVADGIMVARGDLGVETPYHQLPMVQKKIIEAGRRAGKPVITATQMLRSMIDNPRPSRAEASDVANAVLDGTSALMLSEETAVGGYPWGAVRAMAALAVSTEPAVDMRRFLAADVPVDAADPAWVSRAAVALADNLGAKAIASPTRSGASIRYLARYRPQVPILGLSSNPRVVARMALDWGVIPHRVHQWLHFEELADVAEAELTALGLVVPGDRFVLTAGTLGPPDSGADTITVVTVGHRPKGYKV